MPEWWAVANLKDPHDASRFQVAKLEGSSEADQVFPIFSDELGVDRALNDCIEWAIVGRLAYAPKPCPTDIRQTRAKLIAQKPEQAEDGIRIGGRICHDLDWVEFGFLLQKQRKDSQTVAQGAGNNCGPPER